MLTSLALFHSPNAFTMGLYSPSFFAARVSKPLDSFSVSCLCSAVIAWARARRAGGIDSGDAAFAHQQSMYRNMLTPPTRALQANAAPEQRPSYTRKAVATYPRGRKHSRGQVPNLDFWWKCQHPRRIPSGSECVHVTLSLTPTHLSRPSPAA